jgi:hypothetical protein
VGLAYDCAPAPEVVSQGGDHAPGAIGGELARGEVAEGLVFEIADRELDDGVLAMLGFDELQRVGAVGREREVLPVGEQLRLVADQAHAADDQPPVTELGLGDLRLAAVGIVREGLPLILVDLIAQRADVLALLDADRELDVSSIERFEQLVVLKPGVGTDQEGVSSSV